MATTITIKASSQSGWIKVYIDGDEKLSGLGTTQVSLESGHHSLTYFVQGSVGDKYDVSIELPASLKWKVSGKLSSDHTTGQHGFFI